MIFLVILVILGVCFAIFCWWDDQQAAQRRAEAEHQQELENRRQRAEAQRLMQERRAANLKQIEEWHAGNAKTALAQANYLQGTMRTLQIMYPSASPNLQGLQRILSDFDKAVQKAHESMVASLDNYHPYHITAQPDIYRLTQDFIAAERERYQKAGVPR